MKWSDAYSTGIERIDDQHKSIFKMSEDFRAALDDGQGKRVYGSLLQSLDVYARSHFRFEEGCMDRCHCPAAQGNKEAHAKFVEMLARFQQRYAAGGFDPEDGRKLTDTIDAWLTDHICRIDIQLKDWVNKT